MIKVGNYIIYDWEKSEYHTSNDESSYFRPCDDGVTIFSIFLFYAGNSTWVLQIHNKLLLTYYKSMFHNCMEFNSFEAGKTKVDLFVEKLQKLKVFL